MQAIVLVGGEGTRLRPLTESTPKPALTLVDRPFLAYMIEWLAGHGVTEVVLACGFLPDVLRAALSGEEERAGVRIRYVAEPEPLGTAGAIRFAADALGDELEDRFLALNGDVLTDLDLSTLLRAHQGWSAAATIGLHPVEDSSAFGLVHSDDGGAVLEFLEKTGERKPGEVNAGMYVLQRSVLDLIPPGENVSIERDVFPRLVGKGLHGRLLDGYWLDIGTPKRYRQASWDILEGRVETRVEPTFESVLVDPGAHVDSAAKIGPQAVIGPGCQVEAGAQILRSVVLDDCTVGENAHVVDSILSPRAEVPPGAVVEGAVAAEGERLLG
ncbi:MAG TPA: NDP-sugar synthase [Solirubrobacterales bacterium]|nr:NDP-sugar synthase [Solirubrobacterales bacterium]